MYEVRLMLNIAWEIALGMWPVLLGGVVLWGALMLAAWMRQGTRRRSGLPLAMVMATAGGRPREPEPLRWRRASRH